MPVGAALRRCGLASALAIALAPAGHADPASRVAGFDTFRVQHNPQWRYIDILEALDGEGYTIVSVTDTLLNRVKIRARSREHLREIVVSRASGQILRDAVIETYDYRPAGPERSLDLMLLDLPPQGVRSGQ
ncbi:hypothetical protein GVY41_05360 [Frigidibacter albus]|uniref:Uncharacterized protein n=1 Tax=Frigidibacter albus TaxID=1465486 RepID=A0A6L8VHG3_9RHOB|nr:hypothetical protein [Frigidibacter albus]MZQ88759.1 hypothetical protein [Frigidibacter albus]NBE30432.1 hypothetical protein [Frigidibacter albus]GGH50315.1 hypothetical protein GCM10011341_13210 [Frigidibacter albus]